MKLTKEQCEEFFYNALCNGWPSIQSHGLKISYENEQYDYIRNLLKSSKDDVCYEDVLMQMIKRGGCVTFIDEEGEEDAVVRLNNIHENMELVPEKHLQDMLNEEDDADTADAILQTILYKEIIFS